MIDDFTVVETLDSRGAERAGSEVLERFPGSAHAAMVRVCGLMSVPLAAKKRACWTQTLASCGAITDLTRVMTDGSCTVAANPSTVKKAQIAIQEAITQNCLTPASAASLRESRFWHFNEKSI
jgi:hypothetical protein